MIQKLKKIIFPFKPFPCKQVERALIKLGFIEDKAKGTSHRQFRQNRNTHLYKVTLDCHRGEVSAYNIKSMVAQSGFSKVEFLEALES